MYDGREKQIEIAESINTKADEIESYVLQIITASREDFLSLEVEMGEFYLSELISKIKLYYTEKLRLIRTDFFVGSYMDRLLKGDLDRSVEVLQNHPGDVPWPRKMPRCHRPIDRCLWPFVPTPI